MAQAKDNLDELIELEQAFKNTYKLPKNHFEMEAMAHELAVALDSQKQAREQLANEDVQEGIKKTVRAKDSSIYDFQDRSESGIKGLARGFLGSLQAVFEHSEGMYEAVSMTAMLKSGDVSSPLLERMKTEDFNFSPETRETIDGINKWLIKQRHALKVIPAEYHTPISQYIGDVVEQAPQMAMVWGLAMVNPALGSAALGTYIFGDYGELRDNGTSKERALIASGFNASSQMLMESIPMFKFLNLYKMKGGKKAIGKAWLELIIAEPLTEAGQEFPEKLTRIWAEGEKTGDSVKDTATKMWEAMPETMKEGVYAGLVVLPFALGGGVVRLPSLIQHGKSLDNHQKLFEQINNKVQSIEITKKNPGLVEKYLNDLAKENNLPDNFFVSKTELQSVFGDNLKKIANELGISDQLNNATDKNPMFQISVGKFSTILGGSEQGQKLTPFLRAKIDGQTLEQEALGHDLLKKHVAYDNFKTALKDTLPELIKYYQTTNEGKVLLEIGGKARTLADLNLSDEENKRLLLEHEYNENTAPKDIKIFGENMLFVPENELRSAVVKIADGGDILTGVEEYAELYAKNFYGEFLNGKFTTLTGDLKAELDRLRVAKKTTMSDVELFANLAKGYALTENPESFWGKNPVSAKLKALLEGFREYIQFLIRSVSMYSELNEKGLISDRLKSILHESVKADFSKADNLLKSVDSVRTQVKSTPEAVKADETISKIEAEKTTEKEVVAEKKEPVVKGKRKDGFSKFREKVFSLSPILSSIKSYGGISHQTKGFKGGEYDGLNEGNFSKLDRSFFMTKKTKDKEQGKNTPDIIADMLFREGLISEPDVDTLWSVLRSELDNVKTNKELEAEQLKYWKMESEKGEILSLLGVTKNKTENVNADDNSVIAHELENFLNNPVGTFNFPKSISQNILSRLGRSQKPLILKQNIVEKNKNHHSDLTIKDDVDILLSSIYEPTEIIQSLPSKKPNYFSFVKFINKGKQVQIELSEGKDNYEIIGWHYSDDKSLDRQKKRAEREGGEILIIPDMTGIVGTPFQRFDDSNNIITQNENKPNDVVEKSETEQEERDTSNDWLFNESLAEEEDIEEDKEIADDTPVSEIVLNPEEATVKNYAQTVLSPKVEAIAEQIETTGTLTAENIEDIKDVQTEIEENNIREIAEKELQNEISKANAESNSSYQIGLYHGSPYNFDRFSLNHIGKGEGAQSFGWGLYFTEKEDIARYYADKLGEKKLTVNGKDIKNYQLEYYIKANYNSSSNVTLKEALKHAESDYKSEGDFSLKETIEELTLLIENKAEVKASKNLYSVTVHKGKTPEQYDYLRWDKPITEEQIKKIHEQSKKEKLTLNETIYALDNGKVLNNGVRYNTGGNLIYSALKTDLGSDKLASKFLLNAGIDGIKYPTESTTGKKSDAFNYVVFNDKEITIESNSSFNFVSTADNLSELARIKEQYQNTDKWLKAPNGKPTKLTELQWLQVRTQAFKNWFGDWENSPETASKVLDENGEPLVVYHGSRNGDFTVFDASKGNPVLDGGMYFSSSKELSKKFAGPKGSLYEVFLKIENPHRDTFTGSGADMSKSIYRDGGIFRKTDTDRYANKGDKEYIVFSSTQIKSATGNIGTFDGANPNISYQFVGEKGASALDQAEEATTRLDNLSIAREMETAGKDVKAIRLATGWERGADKKWRYEIDNGKLDLPKKNTRKIESLNPFELSKEEVKIAKELSGFTGTNEEYAKQLEQKYYNELYDISGQAFNLSDIYVNEKLYKSYPQLKSMNVKFLKKIGFGTGGMGEYNHDTKTIILKLDNTDTIKSTLLHEIQHAIQEIEGFAKGGNSEDMLAKSRPKTKGELLDEAKKELLEKQKKYKAEFERVRRDYFNRIDEINKKKISDKEKYELKSKAWIDSDGSALYMKIQREIESMPKTSEFDYASNIPYTRDALDKAFKDYEALAGEVEARNVQSRMNLTPEQRRETLLKDTEDVAREDQIFLDSTLSNVSYSMSQDWVGKKLSEVRRELPKDNDIPIFHSNPYTSNHESIMKEALDIWDKMPEKVIAFDGREILIKNPDNNIKIRPSLRVGYRLIHSLSEGVEDKNYNKRELRHEIDSNKVKWLPNIVTTLKKGQIILKDPESGYILYTKKYKNGVIHFVIVDTKNNGLITQFPSETGVGKRDKYEIVIVKNDGRDSIQSPSGSGNLTRNGLSSPESNNNIGKKNRNSNTGYQFFSAENFIAKEIKQFEELLEVYNTFENYSSLDFAERAKKLMDTIVKDIKNTLDDFNDVKMSVSEQVEYIRKTKENLINAIKTNNALHMSTEVEFMKPKDFEKIYERIKSEFDKLKDIAQPKDLEDIKANIQKLQSSLLSLVNTLPKAERYKFNSNIAEITSKYGDEKATKKYIDKSLKAMDRVFNAYKKKEIIKDIIKDIHNFREKKDFKGRPISKIYPEVQSAIKIISNSLFKRKDVQSRILALTSKDSTLLTENEQIELYLLVTFGNINSKSIDDVRMARMQLIDIIADGMSKRLNQIRLFESNVRKERNIIIDTVGGEKYGLKARTLSQEQRRHWSRVFSSPSAFQFANLSFEWVMNNISRKNKNEESGNGYLVQKWAKDVMRASANKQTMTNKQMEELLTVQQEIFKTKSSITLHKKLRDFQTIKYDTGIYIKAKNPNTGNFDGPLEALNISQDTAVYLYLASKQSGVFERMFATGWDDIAFDSLKAFMTPEAFAYADWLSVQYKNSYNPTNNVYKKLFFTNLPVVENYAPMSYLVVGKTQENVNADIENLTFGGGNHQATAMFGSLISRVDHSREINYNASATALYMRHVNNTAHFITHAELAKEMRAVWKNENVRNALKQNLGNSKEGMLQYMIDNIIRGGMEDGKVNKAISKLMSFSTKWFLSFKAVTFLKQWSSAPAYMMDVPILDFFKYSAEFWANPIKNIDELKKVEYINNRWIRGNSFEMSVTLREAEGKPKNYIGQAFNAGMLPVRLGDILPVMTGYYIVQKSKYKQFINKGMSHEDALIESHLEAGMASDRSQQASGIKDISYIRQQGSWVNMLQMFSMSQNQYMNILTESWLDVKAGKKGALQKATKNTAVIILLGLMFQGAGDVFSYLLSGGDDVPDWEDYLLAGLISPLGGYLFVGNVLMFAMRKGFDLPAYKLNFSPALDVVETIATSMQSLTEADFERALKNLTRNTGIYTNFKPFVAEKK